MIININASSMNIPSIKQLFSRGLATFTDDEGLKERTVLEYAQNHAVLVGFDVGPYAFCILHLPDEGAIEQIPQVLHFYSEGKRAQTRELVSAVLDFVKREGYNTLRAINGSGRRDEAWLRVFRHKDWNIKPVKTVFDFEVKQ